ncbi:WxL domain-containing protein, partial [Enterococcus sp. DIV0840c]|uniref:WxL domain-containing protein n=1 Tax=Enterococcus sp. DIV0840c TaxID=2774772 RepID=UPI003D285D32
LSAQQGLTPQEWIIRAARSQHTFDLPVVFETAGSYDVTAEDATGTIDIRESEEEETEVHLPHDTEDSTEHLEEEDEPEAEKTLPVDEENEAEQEPPALEDTKEDQAEEERPERVIEERAQTTFAGETAEVATMAEFRAAVANPEIGTISVQANLTEATANIMTVDRPLLIQGNGHTLTFGNNGFYFQLGEVTEASAFRVENATITKVGVTPLVNATAALSSNWTFELETITEVNANTLRLAFLPEGRVLFTGGTSNFTRTTSAQTFIEAKEISATNQAQVTISRGNGTVFFSPATVAAPKLTIDNGASITVNTTAGVANTINFRGERPEIQLQTKGQLIVSTVGTTAVPTDTSNNTIALTGVSPKITVMEESRLAVTSTLAKRGVHLAGNDAELAISDSALSVRSATQAAVNLSGANPSVSVKNSTSQLISTTGQTMVLNGTTPTVSYEGSTGEVTSTTGVRLNMVGETPKLSLIDTELTMSATTGGGIYLQGATPQLLLDDSQLEMTNTGASVSGVWMPGTDAILSLSNKSTFNMSNGGTVATDAIRIGNNSGRPELSVTGGSKLSVTTTGATTAATDTANNAINLWGSEPKATVSENSELTISVTSNARRGLYLNGAQADLTVSDSKLDVTTVSGAGITFSGNDALFQAEGTEATIQSTTGTRMNFVGLNPTFMMNKSQLTMSATTGGGIYLQGATPQLLLDDSQLEMTNTGASVSGVWMPGTDAILSLSNKSTFNMSNGGTVATDAIRIGNNSGRPELSVTGGSKLSVTTTGATTAATDTANNAINLWGSEPKATVSENSELTISVTSNARRGLYLNGSDPEVIIDDSIIDMQGFTGQMLRLAGENPSLNLNNSNAILRTTTTATIAFQGTNAELSAINSEIRLIEGTSGNRIHFANGQSTMNLNNTILETETTNGIGINMTGNNNSLTLANSSEITMNSTNGNNILLTGNNTSLAVLEGSRLNTMSGAIESIQLAGNNTILRVLDPDTRVSARSNFTSDVNGQSTIRIGGLDQETRSEKYLIEVGKGALLESKANISSAMQVSANDGVFNVFDQGQLLLESGATNGLGANANATLRFSRTGTAATTGGHSFLIDNGSIEINKTGGNAAGLRMFGSNNQIRVQNKGEFFINNLGSGSGTDGGSGSSSQGIDFREGNNNQFIVVDPGSRVEIDAQSGPAVDMNGGTGFITASNGGYFEAVGRTATATAGIFNAGALTVDFDNPLFMDFRNNRPGGGNIFNNTASSRLEAKNSDLAVWRNGSNLSGDPDLNFPTLDFSFTGTNFNTLGATNKPDILNTTTFGTTGLTAYSRLSSNNARWVIVDELRVPTNADKKIHGHVSIPVGLDASRSAWEGEATVVVEVERADGSKVEYTTTTEGHSIEEPGISIYGEEPRGGLFEIELPDSLQKGDKVRIKEAYLTSGELSQGYENIILTETVEVFPIIPPTPAQFSSSVIANDSTSIRGYSENKDAEVTATHNGEPLDTGTVTIDSDGNFTLDLSTVSLEEDDEIQVFLRDTEGSAHEAGVINPPETNNDRGNINPATALAFHDVTFEAATLLTVADLGPVSPVDPLDPEIEVDPENKPDLPEDQGRLSIDFISQFSFGEQPISVPARTYFAQPQRLLNEDGTVNEEEVRPNYVQISDRRPEAERHGWQLAVTQKEQFSGENDQELTGASLRLTNQQLVTAQGGKEPALQATNPMALVPGSRRTLLRAEGGEGSGTWIYRFGDGDTADQSVSLEVPQGTTPDASKYTTTLEWELSSVPGN